MNSKAAASHVRKQSFHEDEYRAFRIALDVKETEIVDFWNNIDELKSKKEFLRVREDLKPKIMRKKNTLKEKNSNYDEKRITDKKKKAKPTLSKIKEDKENICGLADVKENALFTSDKDSELKKKESTGATKKKINQKKTKTTDDRHTSVTDATNMMQSGLDDVRKKVTKGAREFMEKENVATSQEIGKIRAGVSKKKGRKNIKKNENVLDNVGKDYDKVFDWTDENRKPKVKWQVQLNEKKISTKRKENVEAEEKSSNIADIEEKDSPKENRSEKKKNVPKENEESVIRKKIPVRKLRPRKIIQEKAENFSESDGREIREKETCLIKRKTPTKKSMPEGEKNASKPAIKGKDAGSKERESKKYKKGNKTAEDKERKSKVLKKSNKYENIEEVEDQEESEPKKSRNRKTGKSTDSKLTTKLLNKKEDKKLIMQGEGNVINKMDDKTKIVNPTPTKVTENIESSTTLTKPLTLENIDQSVFKKCNFIQNDLKNEECGFQDKSFEKPSLAEVMESPYLFEKENMNSANDKSFEDLKKYSACALDEENKCQKPGKTKTLHEIKEELKQTLKKIRYEKKMAKAVEKLSQYALKHVKKLDLDSNPVLKHHLGLESNSDSDSVTSSDSENSSDFYCSECSCSSDCSCSCCSDFGSSDDSECSSSSCSCSNCCSNNSYYSAFSNSSSDSSDSDSN